MGVKCLTFVGEKIFNDAFSISSPYEVLTLKISFLAFIHLGVSESKETGITLR